MNWKLCGHENAVAYLREHSKAEKTRQAYLITGPDGVGRKSLALAFVKAIACQAPPEPGSFCGSCTPCKQIDARAFSDLTIVEREAGKEIKIDQIREMQKTLTLAPFQAPRRVVLIPDFQKASIGASNALLKSLEEPPPRALIILTADARESLLETIASRCEHIRLYPMPVDAAKQALQEHFALPDEEALQLAHLTGGRIGAALRLKEDPGAIDNQRDVLVELEDLLLQPYRRRLKYVEDLVARKQPPREQAARIIPVWLGFWRDALILSSGSKQPLVYLQQKEIAEKAASQIPLEQIQTLLLAHERALEQLDFYVNARLILENLLLASPRLQ